MQYVPVCQDFQKGCMLGYTQGRLGWAKGRHKILFELIKWRAGNFSQPNTLMRIDNQHK